MEYARFGLSADTNADEISGTIAKLQKRVDWKKRSEAGRPEKYKARLVVRGFSQKSGFDYSETYSPVAKMDILRAVLPLANQSALHIHQSRSSTVNSQRRSLCHNQTGLSKEEG